MFIATIIAVLALQYGVYRAWRSYRNAADRVESRVERVVQGARTEYTGPTYSPWGNEQ